MFRWRDDQAEVRELAASTRWSSRKAGLAGNLLCPRGDYKRFLDAYLAEQGEPPLETPVKW